MSKNYRGRCENIIRSLEKFLKDNTCILANVLAMARAWTDIFVSNVTQIAAAERKFFEPLERLLPALRYDFVHWSTWKAVIKLGVRRL